MGRRGWEATACGRWGAKEIDIVVSRALVRHAVHVAVRWSSISPGSAHSCAVCLSVCMSVYASVCLSALALAPVRG